jgi:hypothetical protein
MTNMSAGAALERRAPGLPVWNSYRYVDIPLPRFPCLRAVSAGNSDGVAVSLRPSLGRFRGPCPAFYEWTIHPRPARHRFCASRRSAIPHPYVTSA